MLGQLTDKQIDHVLYSQIIGRIGCCSEGEMYIVPLTYVFDKGYIYAHSKEGLKVQLMRKNPKVCFEVDSVENMTNWRSVILWGEYEELRTEKEQKAAMEIMLDRLTPYMTSETVRPSQALSRPPKLVEKEFKAVAYRIRVLKRTGRYEKTTIGQIGTHPTP